MNIGYNSGYTQLASLSPVGQQPTPYSPSYTVPIQPTGNAPAMRPDNYESTRDKSFGDFAGGFITGAGKAIYDMGHGVVFLGKLAGQAVSHPINSAKFIGGAIVHGVSNPIQTGSAIVSAPFKIARGIVKPYSQAFKQGHYGEAMGRLTVDITVLAAAFGNKKPAVTEPPPAVVEPPPAVVDIVDKVDDVVAPLTPVGGGGSATNTVNNTLGDIKDILKEVGNVTGNGNTVNVNIGDIIIGGQKGTNMTASTSGALGGAQSAAGAVLNNADEAAKVVSSGAATYAEAGSTVSAAAETVTAASGAAASSTFGQSVGHGIDLVIGAPGKVFRGIGSGFDKVGNAIKKVGHVLTNPRQYLTGLNPVNTAEWIGNGLKAGADMAANGLVFAATNPKQAIIITAAVGRGGKAAEDILMEFDLVR